MIFAGENGVFAAGGDYRVCPPIPSDVVECAGVSQTSATSAMSLIIVTLLFFFFEDECNAAPRVYIRFLISTGWNAPEFRKLLLLLL